MDGIKIKESTKKLTSLIRTYLGSMTVRSNSSMDDIEIKKAEKVNSSRDHFTQPIG